MRQILKLVAALLALGALAISLVLSVNMFRQSWLEKSYPCVHQALSRRVIAGASLLFQWQSRDPAFAPILIVTPGLMIAAADSRHFQSISDDVYRFTPVRAGPSDLDRFHGTDERISESNLVEMIHFYLRLVMNASRWFPIRHATGRLLPSSPVHCSTKKYHDQTYAAG